ncbi:hypothetical protein NQ315_012188, partial [Exocentrus adspersus]
NYSNSERSILDLWKLYPLTILENSNVSSDCKTAYDKYLSRFHRNDLNATKMFDATAKLPSGILRGNVNQYGDFDECMELDEAQYCLADINIEPLWKEPYLKFKNMVHSNFPIRDKIGDPKHRVPGFTLIRWGFCIPKDCTNTDLEIAIYEKLQITSSVQPNMCQKANPHFELTYGYILAVCFFLTIAVLIGASTLLSSWNLNEINNSVWIQILMCFAIQRNFKQLTAVKESKGEIQALHGVRALSALGLIISHKVMALYFNPFMNRSVMSEVSKCTFGMKWSVIGRTAIIYTECFMLLSGLLGANAMFSDLDRRKTIVFKDKLINRIFRIT